MTSISAQWKKLRAKGYREEFVVAQAKRAIPFQIRALMRKKKISQEELAERSGLTQGVISRAASPNYGKMTLTTILRVAAGFDVAFVGVYVPFGRLVDFFDTMSEARLGDVLTFEEEDELLEKQVAKSVADRLIDTTASEESARVLNMSHRRAAAELQVTTRPRQLALDFENQSLNESNASKWHRLQVSIDDWTRKQPQQPAAA